MVVFTNFRVLRLGVSNTPAAAEVAAPSQPTKAASKDVHNDTTVSDISADITMDSVKDHTM